MRLRVTATVRPPVPPCLTMEMIWRMWSWSSGETEQDLMSASETVISRRRKFTRSKV